MDIAWVLLISMVSGIADTRSKLGSGCANRNRTSTSVTENWLLKVGAFPLLVALTGADTEIAGME